MNFNLPFELILKSEQYLFEFKLSITNIFLTNSCLIKYLKSKESICQVRL